MGGRAGQSRHGPRFDRTGSVVNRWRANAWSSASAAIIGTAILVGLNEGSTILGGGISWAAVVRSGVTFFLLFLVAFGPWRATN